MTAARTILGCAWCLVLACGCALTAKGEPLQVRYFSPVSTARAAAPVVAPSTGIALSLGRVEASSYLRERIAYRASSHELGFYESLRWTERPESYLRRALATSLFQERGVEPVVGGPGATLEVELVTFEEERKPARVARVQIGYLLYGGGVPPIERTVVAEQPIRATEDPTIGVIDALSAALDQGVQKVSDEVIAHLHAAVPPVSESEQAARAAACALQGRPPWTTPPTDKN